MTSRPSAQPLTRHLSAPTGAARRNQAARPVQHLASQFNGIKSTAAVSIPQRRHRNSVPNASHSSWCRSHLKHIDEIEDYSPADWLARSEDEFAITPTISLTPSAYERSSELQPPNYSNLTPFQSTFDSPGSLSPMTATSDSSLTSASTVMSGEPMSRANTNDMICGPLEMFRMDSMQSMQNTSQCDLPASSYSTDYDSFSIPVYPHANQSFPDGLSYQESLSFPSSLPMKHSSSQDSDASSAPNSHSRMSRRVHEQNAHGKARPLAPKTEPNDGSSSDEEHLHPKYVEFTEADGTIRKKAEITRQPTKPQQRKTTHCTFCNEQPMGFHGDHELRRHIERHHSTIRKVWICQNPPDRPGWLDSCKSCRNQKSYGANYNAAAHLRRTHFNPCKNKRGGRNKKNEGRGGMGGGHEPSMEVLKHYMFERLERNVNGTNVWEVISSTGDVSPIPMPMKLDSSSGEEEFDFGMQTPIDFSQANFDPAFYPHQQETYQGYR